MVVIIYIAQLLLFHGNNTSVLEQNIRFIWEANRTGEGGTISYVKLEEGKTRSDWTPNNQNVYSTTEKRVGTWIDSKPIYSKTFSTPQFSNTDTTLSTGLTDIDKIIEMEGILWRNDVQRYYNLENGLIGEINVVHTTGVVHFSTNTQYATFESGYITLYYTKTTD